MERRAKEKAEREARGEVDEPEPEKGPKKRGRKPMDPQLKEKLRLERLQAKKEEKKKLRMEKIKESQAKKDLQAKKKEARKAKKDAEEDEANARRKPGKKGRELTEEEKEEREKQRKAKYEEVKRLKAEKAEKRQQRNEQLVRSMPLNNIYGPPVQYRCIWLISTSCFLGELPGQLRNSKAIFFFVKSEILIVVVELTRPDIVLFIFPL